VSSEARSVTVGSRLRPRDDVAWVTVLDEVVVYEPERAVSYVLSPTAALVWRCLDGHSTLGEIIDDVAAAFEVEHGRVSEEVLAVTGRWADAGFVEEADDG
jgi:hypothetical protein